MNDFTIVLRSLRVRWLSTLVTVLSVAIAVALILVLLTMRDSGKKSFERGAGDMHLLVSADASPLTAVLNNVFYARPPRRPMTWERFEQLEKQAPWAYAVPTQIGDNFRGFPVVATSRDMFDGFKPAPGEAWKLSQGTFFEKDFEVVLGSTVAARTGLKIGDQIYMTHGWSSVAQGTVTWGDIVGQGGGDDHDHHGHDHDHAHDHGHDHAHGEDDEGHAPHLHKEFPHTVVGILAPTLTSHDRALFTNLESSWIKHAHDRRVMAASGGGDVTTAREDLLPEDRKITAAFLRLITREGSDVPANLPQVFEQLRRDPTITVANPSQEIGGLFVIVDQVNRLFLVIASIVMLTSGIGIMLALYNSMEQRRRQIAVLRVLGASQGRIFNLVLVECALIGLAGALAGAVLAIAGAWLASGTLRARLGLIIEPAVSPVFVVALIGATVLLAMLAGLIPAVMAYRTSVARSLRPIG